MDTELQEEHLAASGTTGSYGLLDDLFAGARKKNDDDVFFFVQRSSNSRVASRAFQRSRGMYFRNHQHRGFPFSIVLFFISIMKQKPGC